MKKLLLFVLISVAIFVRYKMVTPEISDGQKIKITQQVLSEPIRYERVQRIVLYGLKIYLPIFPEINYGDTVIVEGIVKKDTLSSANLVDVKPPKGTLFNVRKKVIENYKRILPQPHSSLVAGMVLGSKQGITREFWEQLKVSGTAHVVVASGMNVTLVASFLVGIFLLFLPRTKAVVAAIVGIWLYATLSGLDAPIVRAAIMGTIAFGAQALGRVYLAWRGLLFSIAAMLLVNPLWLFDLGFILSSVATASLMIFERKVSSLISFVPSLFKEGLSTSLAAQIGVAPILYLAFGQFNIFSPLINALVLWTVSLITVIGALGGIVALVWLPLGRLILLTVYPLTSWFVYIVEVFGK